MGYQNVHDSSAAAWALTSRQHGVVSRAQLVGLGFHPQAIKHRLAAGRLHGLFRGVYAVGRPEVTREGWWMAAVLSCGEGAVLSHTSAAELWGIHASRGSTIHVSVPRNAKRRADGIVVHRQAPPDGDITRRRGIPVTSPLCTLIDIAITLGRDALEAAINEADKLGLIDPESLRQGLERFPGRSGVPALRTTLDHRTFTLTDSQLERLFLQLAKRAGLSRPLTQVPLNGFTVDFYWPELGLVVETDGLRYHRTPAQQARYRVRDQAHAAAGLTPLRFTRAQVRFDTRHVGATLTAVASRLARPVRRRVA